MNVAQRITLIIAFFTILAMSLLPPWLYVHEVPGGRRIERPAGYHLIFGDHTPRDIEQLTKLFGLPESQFGSQLEYFAVRLDGIRLIAQVTLASLLTFILLLAMSR